MSVKRLKNEEVLRSEDSKGISWKRVVRWVLPIRGGNQVAFAGDLCSGLMKLKGPVSIEITDWAHSTNLQMGMFMSLFPVSERDLPLIEARFIMMECGSCETEPFFQTLLFYLNCFEWSAKIASASGRYLLYYSDGVAFLHADSDELAAAISELVSRYGLET